jgi:hypothetical protein
VIDEIRNDCEFIISPNPVKNYFSVLCNKKEASILSIKILDLYGRVIKTSEIPSMDMFNMEAGVYFAEIILDNNKRIIRKIIKAKFN